MLKSQPGVYRCRLRLKLNKRAPPHADYKGILQLSFSILGLVRKRVFRLRPSLEFRPATKGNISILELLQKVDINKF
jgi:hypothetical protein